MRNLFLEEYRSYKKTGDTALGEILSAMFYSELTNWIKTGKPDEQFLDEFWNLYTHIQSTEYTSTGDLIDLGIMQTAEAVNQYHQEDEDNPGPVAFYLNEARLPFFAYIDEEGYRHDRRENFSEIDFYIFEIISGEFPHAAAQEFLTENDWADIWTALRYLDTISEASGKYSLISELFEKRKTIHEKLILLAYLTVTESEYIESLLSEKTVRLPPEISEDFVYYIYNVLDAALFGHPLSVDWMSRMQEPYKNQTLFFLLAYFEISQSELSPGWITVIEQSLDTVWNYSVASGSGAFFIHQPLQDFTANLLQLFSDEELRTLLDTSLIYPVFFRNITQYTHETLENLLTVLLKNEELMVRELRAFVESLQGTKTALITEDENGILHDIARYFGYEITIHEGTPVLRGNGYLL